MLISVNEGLRFHNTWKLPYPEYFEDGYVAALGIDDVLHWLFPVKDCTDGSPTVFSFNSSCSEEEESYTLRHF